VQLYVKYTFSNNGCYAGTVLVLATGSNVEGRDNFADPEKWQIMQNLNLKRNKFGLYRKKSQLSYATGIFLWERVK
jgi:hypothetical protein